MEKFGLNNQERKFSSPEEELEYLRGEVARNKGEMEEKGETADTSRIISKNYRNIKNRPGKSPCRRI